MNAKRFRFTSSASNVTRAFPASTLCKLWDRDDCSHDVQHHNKEFTVGRLLLGGRFFSSKWQATLIEDKDKCSGQGDELGIDKRFDASLPPPQFNKLPDFPADLDETAVHGYAAECMHAVWMHLDSEAVRDLQETFSGLVRIPVGQGNQAFFEEWYDPLVAVQEDAMQPPSSSCGTLTVAPASHMRRSTLPCCPGSPKHRSLCLRLPCSAICVAPAEVLPPAPQDSQPRSHVCSSTMPTPPKHSAASRSC